MPNDPSLVALLPSLSGALYTLTVDDLKAYASVLTERAPTRKADLVSEIAGALRNPRVVRALWDRLSEVQRQVVAEVVHNLGGRFDSELIEAKYPGSAAPAGAGYSWDWNGSGRKRELSAYDL